MDFLEKTIMLRIRNVLAELKYNGAEIEEIEMYRDLEQNLVIKYKYKGENYIISNDLLND